MSEATLETWARVEIAAHGGLMLKWAAGGYRGIPDDICLWPQGVVHFIEFKDGTQGRLTPAQKLFHQRMLLFGHRVFVLIERDDVRGYIERFAP